MEYYHNVKIALNINITTVLLRIKARIQILNIPELIVQNFPAFESSMTLIRSCQTAVEAMWATNIWPNCQCPSMFHRNFVLLWIKLKAFLKFQYFIWEITIKMHVYIIKHTCVDGILNSKEWTGFVAAIFDTLVSPWSTDHVDHCHLKILIILITIYVDSIKLTLLQAVNMVSYCSYMKSRIIMFHFDKTIIIRITILWTLRFFHLEVDYSTVLKTREVLKKRKNREENTVFVIKTQ